MMQRVAVKNNSSVLWYVISLISEVFRCAMGRGHPKWSVNTLNLLVQTAWLESRYLC